MESLRLWNKQMKRYRCYTRIVAVLDVALATLGFFFNPFNDEVADVPFLYWKITLTSLIFEIWMIVSINLFVATQKTDPEKAVKYCNYWLIVATLAFVVFQGIIIFPIQRPTEESKNPLSNIYFSTGVLLYRIFATIIIVKFRSWVGCHSDNEDWDLIGSAWKDEQGNLYPDLLNGASMPCGCGVNDGDLKEKSFSPHDINFYTNQLGLLDPDDIDSFSLSLDNNNVTRLQSLEGDKSVAV